MVFEALHVVKNNNNYKYKYKLAGTTMCKISFEGVLGLKDEQSILFETSRPRRFFQSQHSLICLLHMVVPASLLFTFIVI